MDRILHGAIISDSGFASISSFDLFNGRRHLWRYSNALVKKRQLVIILHYYLIGSEGLREQLYPHVVHCCGGGYIVNEHLWVIDIGNGSLQITVSANSLAGLPG